MPDDGETFEVQFQDLSDADGRVVLGDPAVSTVTISEGATLALEFSATDAMIAEGDDAASAGSTTVTATASMARTTAWTVEISAQSADDARWAFVDANRTLTFESNQTTSTGVVTIRAVPNDLDEPDLEVTVRGTPEASTGLPSASAILTLTDDDLPKVSIAAPKLARETGHVFESEAAHASDRDGWWVLTRARVTDEELTVNLSVSETDGDVVEADKESTTQMVKFGAGKATTSYSPITNDEVDKVHGNVTVTVESGTDYEVAPDGASASALVRDDDGALVSFAITPAALSVSEGQTRNLTIVSQTVQDMTFTSVGDLGRVFGGDPVAAVMLGAAPGTASEADYSVGLNPIVFNAAGYQDDGGGGLRGTAAVPFSALADSEDDGGETVTVSITGVTPGVAGDTRIATGTVTASVVTIVEGPALTFSVTPTDLAEGATATVTASVEPVHDAPFTVTVAGTSTDDTRWEFVGGATLTFAANQAAPTGTVTIRAIGNAVDDGDLDITLTGTPSVTEVAPPAPVVLTVLDDDLPQVSIAAPTLARNMGHVFEHEAAGTTDANWVLTRVGLTNEALTVNLSVDDTSTFTAGAATTATFGAGESTVRYTPVANDTADEGHGTVTVTVAPVADLYAVVPGSASAMAAVRDDDGPLLEVSIDAAVTAPEGMAAVFGAKAENSDGTLTVAGDLARLFSGLTAVTVNAQSADGSAMAASDYTAFDGSVALDAFEVTALGGRWSGNVSVQTTEDMVTEGSEGFTVTLSLPAGTDSRIALSATDATGTATIVEGPALTLSVAPEELAEGATATVTASVEPTHDADFTVAVAGMSDDDDRWEFVGGTTLTFEASQASPTGSVTIRAILNDVDEVDLDITLTGTPSVAAVAAPADVVLTVLDDDLPTVSIAAPTLVRDTGHLYEIEADTNRWELTRAGLTEEALTVDLSVSDTGAFTVAGAAATAVFSAGMDTTSYTPITADELDEAHGTVTVTVDAGTGYAPGTASSAAVAVRDDDGPLLEVSIDAVITVPEGMAAVFGAKAENSDGTLTAAGDLARLFSGLTAVTVNAQSADGSAMAASDYTAFDGSVALDAFEVTALGGRWSGNVSVRTTEDMVAEGSQDFTVTLSLPGGTDARIALKSGGETGTATIVEGPALTLSVAPEELAEGATATVTASVDPVHDAAFTVAVAGMSDDDDRWEFVGGTTLTFEASQASPTGSVSIRAILNDVDEVDLDITLTGTPSVAAVAAPADVVLTVLDDDLPTVSIAAPTGTVDGFLYEAEAATDESRYRWSLTRDGLTDGELSVDVSVAETGGGDFVADGTDIVMFDAGESTVFYTPITADTDDEAHGTVTVTVDSGTGYALGTASSAEVDVRDDDGTLLTVSLEPSSLTVSEGGAARFEVVAATVFDDTFTAPGDLDRVFSVQNLPVLVSSTDGTAMSDDGDYEKKDTTTTVAFADFSASGTGSARGLRGRFATDSFEAYADAVEDADETFNVGVRFSGAVDGRIALDADNSSSVATIVEGPSVTLTLSDDDLDERDTATVTATVDPVHDMAFTVTLAAESNADRIEFPDGTTFTFAASATTASATLTVEAVDNDVDDGDAEVEIEATVSDAAVTAPALTLTVRDDDDPTVSIAAPAGAMDDFLYEAEAAVDAPEYQWSLTRVGLTDEELIVDVSVADTSTFAAATAATVTFEAGESTAAYTPITAADTVDDTHGTVTVTVDPGTGYAVDPDAASAAVDVRDDDGELVTVTLDPTTLTVKEGREAQLYAEAETEEDTFDDAADMTRLFGTLTQASVEASTEASTGTGAATADTDYTALAATTVELPFADFEPGSGGVLRLRVELPAIATAEDEVDDPDETFEVKLAAPADQDARIAVSTTAATVTINEGPPDGAIRLCSGTAASTCTDADKALASRNSEGRVEVIYNDEWGTVCDDYWSNGDGNVACTQMGYPGAERVFWSSHFGGAARGTRMWLDNLQCVGDEDDLLECRRRGSPAVGDHNCSDRRHTEDAGVRCLKAESELHGAKVDPLTLTIAPGRTGRYWVSLTKDPEADVLVHPKLDTEAKAALEVTKGPLPFPKDQWSYALDVDVTVTAGAALGTYTVTHTMDLHNNDVKVSDPTELTFAVPPVTVKVVASTSVTGPAPVSATVSGRDASVRFDAPLDASFGPSAADFAVLADGRRLAVTGAWTAGRSLLLELAEPATGAVRLAYVPSAAAPLGGRDGSPVSPFETLAPFEALALAAPGELADDAPDALTADVEPKLEGAPGLEAALADALHHAPGPVAATLAAPRRAVKDLTGLGAVPQLRRVNLAGNAVTDAGPLALLGDLERLDLSDNAVQDLWPLSGLAELRVLNLSGNRVTDVTALAGLPRLRVLELSDNAVVDLSPLGALPALEYLGVAGNRVTDVTALADLHALTRLDLGGNAVLDAAPLGDVGRLVWLRLSGNRLATLDGLGRLTKLRWVWVADNPLPDGTTVAWPERAWVDVAAGGR